MAKISGIAVGAVAAGGLFLYAGITGRSVLSTIQALIQGKAPTTVAKTQEIVPGTDPAGVNTANYGFTGVGGGYSQASVPGSANEASWIAAFLKSIGAPQTPANVSSVSNWIAHEGPYGTQAQNNPLNTTLQLSGSSSFAGLAVQNYPTPAEGMQAIVNTLESGAYSDILALLRAGKGLTSGASQGLSTWSGGGYSSA